jgi:predicted ATPase
VAGLRSGIVLIDSRRSSSTEGDTTQAHEQSLVVQLDLLERDAELAAVVGLIDAIADGGRLLAIEGPPGIGKTALLAEARRLAREEGLRVLGARGSELERSFSYGVVRQLFEALLASLPAVEREELLEGAAALATPLFDPSKVAVEPAGDSSLATLHGLYWLTANLAARRPLVLVLDDLHLADRNTLSLLARVARGATGERLLVLGAYRDADAVGTPLLGAIADLRRDCEVERVAVEGLSVDEVASLLDGAADPRRIHDRTDGNPFYVRELARHLAERKEAAGDVPESVSDVVLARVSRLSPKSAAALTSASVLGESFDLAVLEHLLGADGLLDALDEAAAAGLIEDAAGGRYHFAHALTRDAVYGGIGPARRSDLHRRAAAALERVHGLEPGPELAMIALHLLEAAREDDRDRAVELAERAAEWALERNAYEQAVTLLTRALAVLGDAHADVRRRLTRRRAVAFARLTHALFDVES